MQNQLSAKKAEILELVRWVRRARRAGLLLLRMLVVQILSLIHHPVHGQSVTNVVCFQWPVACTASFFRNLPIY